jgi:hypothetical protein
MSPCARHSRYVAVRLAAHLVQYKVEGVCGPLIEAFVALMVSLELGCDFAYAERFADTTKGLYPVEYRVPKALQTTVKGKRVAIVSDVINAGSPVRGAFSDLYALDAGVIAIGAVLALGDTIGGPITIGEIAAEVNEFLEWGKEHFRSNPRQVGAAFTALGILNRKRTRRGWEILLDRHEKVRIHDLIRFYAREHYQHQIDLESIRRCEFCANSRDLAILLVKNGLI